ncbi:MAG TPA: long-chain-fatty-acid--CoA ligase [Planctomycetota bacterium]|nr:long-chain-fatty-acid--CoA ligase [Planctomycetota bacterium]
MTETPCTLPGIVRRQAQLRPEATALVHTTRTSYAELDRESDRVASALAAAGVQKGTRVAILDHDSARLFGVVFGIAKAGGVVVGLNWRLSAAEIVFQLDDAEVEVLFVGSQFVDTSERVLERCARIALCVQLDENRAAAAGRRRSYEAWLAAADASPPPVEVGRDDPAVQMYTSGTTGKPKGVVLAHRSFVAVIDSMRQVGDPWIGWQPDDVSLMVIPSFHIGGMWWAMTGFNAGACNVVVPVFAGWSVLRAIAEHRVTRACMVPAMLQVCLSEPDCAQTDFSSLRTIVYGGSPIPRANLQQAMRTFGCGFAQIYGLTETGNTAVCLRPDDHRRDDLLEAAGRPYPGVHVKVVDAQGRPLPAGEIGEICIRSPANMLGYWRRPEANAATLRDGYVHTGDAGLLDDEGYVHVRDRFKDMICSAGENLYPAEIESVLCGHPAVAEAAVIGVPDERWGELAIALVVLRANATASEGEILAHVRTQLADFKVPRRVEFTRALPRTPSGKIQKHILREPYWQGRSRRVN